jgi:hypothetical protein
LFFRVVLKKSSHKFTNLFCDFIKVRFVLQEGSLTAKITALAVICAFTLPIKRKGLCYMLRLQRTLRFDLHRIEGVLLLMSVIFIWQIVPFVLVQDCRAAGVGKGRESSEIGDLWDPNKYISIDEVKPGMEAYCLTVYKGTEIEKFGLEVLSVVRNILPGRDAIFVQGTDERFIHTGPVGGCSGSPVYIDGRLAGALAFGWTFSKDPLYGVTPIEEMLRTGRTVVYEGANTQAEGAAYTFDFTRPINFGDVYKQVTAVEEKAGESISSVRMLPCPLVVSGLPDVAVERLGGLLNSYGLEAVAGPGGGSGGGQKKDVQLMPGSCLSVSLVTGDITLDVIGTVTEVIGDKIYGFGHYFLGYGPVDFPIATGEVHTVVSNVVRSFKFSTSLEVVGALRADESTAVYGQIGARAYMFPMKITVKRYNDEQVRVYNCRVAQNRRLTPILLFISLLGTGYMRGSLPPDHTIAYRAVIEAEGVEPIYVDNVSTAQDFVEFITETIGPVVLLMNNPYGGTRIKSVEFQMDIKQKNVLSHIWSVNLSDSKVKAGEVVDASVVVESYRGDKKSYDCSFRVPENTPAGAYELIVCGGYDYLEFLKRSVPYRFVPENLTSLVEAIKDVLSIRKDRLYCILSLPSGGIALERAELPGLPATKAMVLQDGRRALRIQPYPRWLEESFDTGTVIVGSRNTQLMVDE